MDRFLPTNPRARNAVLAVGALLLTLAFTQLVLPGGRGGHGRGAPMAVVFSGLVTGTLYAVAAVSIVLLYRTQRIINFAVAAMGVLGFTFLTLMIQYTKVPFIISFLVALLLSGAIGTLVGVVLLRFFNSSRLFLTVVTIVGVPAIFGLLQFINRLPWFPPQSQRSLADALTPERLHLLLPFAGWKYHIGKFPIDFGFAQVFALDVAALTFVAIGVFFRYTRTGAAVRALAENPERASLLGIGVGKLSVVIWTIAGLLAGVGVCLSGLAASSTSTNTNSAYDVLLPIFVACVLARMRSFPVAIYASILIGIIQECWTYRLASSSALFSAVLFVGVAIALVVQRKSLSRSEAGAAVSWSGTDEPRPVPRELQGVTALRVARLAFIGLGLVLVIAFPFFLSTQKTILLSIIFVNAIVVLSLVVLTGWTGQVSLGQYGFVAIGSVVGGSLIQRAHVPFWFAVPIAAVITGVLALIVGLPALRIKGLFLLVITLGFAVAVRSVLFSEKYFGWLLPSVAKGIPRPTLFFINFDEKRSMYFLCALALALSIVVVVNLRRSRVGRVLIALRENEANVQSFGVSVVRMKLLAFVIAGVLAGFAGAILAVLNRSVAADTYTVDVSIQAFVQAVVGGVSSPAGALLGSAYFNLTQNFLGGNAILQSIVQAGGPAVILFLAPGGLVAVVNSMRDSVLRIVAQRRRIVVPSLFADYDPELLARQLIPLAEVDPLSGLGALPVERRFTLASELYQGHGERIIDKLAPARTDVETAAIGAAARRAEEFDLDELAEADLPPEETTNLELTPVGSSPETEQ